MIEKTKSVPLVEGVGFRPATNHPAQYNELLQKGLTGSRPSNSNPAGAPTPAQPAPQQQAPKSPKP